LAPSHSCLVECIDKPVSNDLNSIANVCLGIVWNA
jgi:hypothetical protein